MRKTDASVALPEPWRRFLTKLVRAVGQVADLELLEAFSYHRNRRAVVLDPSLHEDERRTLYHFLVRRDERLRDDHVHISVLVLEEQKDCASRGGRPLPHGHEPSDRHDSAVLHLLELTTVDGAAAPESLTSRFHRVAVDAHTDSVIVEEDELLAIDRHRIMLGNGRR